VRTLAILCVDETGGAAGRIPSGARTIPLRELRELGPARALKALRSERFNECLLVVGELRMSSAWLTLCGLALASRAKRRVAVTPSGDELELTYGGFLARELPVALRGRFLTGRVVRDARRRLAELKPAAQSRPVKPSRVLFVRADLGPPLTGGGSLAHILGVTGALTRRGVAVSMTTPAKVSGVEAQNVSVEIVPEDRRFRVSVELPHLAYDETLAPRLEALLAGGRFDLVYARHALGSFAAALASQRAGVPLVVEFNGPEVWIARHWGAARGHLELFASIERSVLRAADLVLAVAAPLVSVLHELGVEERRILVNPNGVDAARFDPGATAAQRAATRQRLGLGEQDVLAGFVGTFGPWHGASVFAQATALLGTVQGLHYLFVGDGPERGRAERILSDAGLSTRSFFTGMVPANETPGWISACDLCVAPHVPNADGTPFFGSPTKLFEYMASGRAILASNLDQIGEVLEHGRNAWLVRPGDVNELAAGLTTLARDTGLRARLGAEALADARAKHSWDAHVACLLERLADDRGSR
jgi:glycosyltransferase involved in cell wall biosynthesis